MILAANKRSAGVPSNRQTLNDEELVRNNYVFENKKHYYRFHLVLSNFICVCTSLRCFFLK